MWASVEAPLRAEGEVTRLFISNIPYKANETDVENVCASVGESLSVVLPTWRDTGRRRGFAIVQIRLLATLTVKAAIEHLSGTWMGPPGNKRKLTVRLWEERGPES